MSLLVRKLAMTSNQVDNFFLYRHPGRKHSQWLVAEHEAQIAAAAPSLKKALRLSLKRHSSSAPYILAAVLVDDTLFAGTSAFRRDEQAMQEDVKMGFSADLSGESLKFGGLKVKKLRGIRYITSAGT